MSARATWQKLQIFKIENGGRQPFWKSLNRHISVKNRPILMKFGTQHQILYPITVTWLKIEIFKIQDGGGRHPKIRFFGYNSSTDYPISAKFCMRKQNGMSTRATWQKLQVFEIQDGGRLPFLKSLNRHFSVKNRLILMKFGTIQDGGGRHLENRFFGHNSSTDCPILAKFCMRKQNGASARTTWQKLQFFKIQDGGRPPFWKSLNRHISVKNRLILMKFGTLHQIFNPITVTWPKIEFFFKFKIAAAAILKIAFLAITHRPIVWFQRNFVRGSRTACSQELNNKICKYLKSKMADSRHFWKSLNRPILMKFGTYSKCCSHVTKNWNF